MVTAAALTGTYRAAFDALEGAAVPGWLRLLRRDAIARFSETGFPTVRREDWRYTSVAPITEAALAPAADGDGHALEPDGIAPFLLGTTGWGRLVFVDGRFSAKLSSVPPLPDGIRVASLAEALDAGEPLLEAHLGRHADYAADGFTALNTAFMRDGAFVHLPAAARLPEPVHLLFIGASRALAQPRNLIVAGRASQATIIEHYVGIAEGVYWTNVVTEVVAEDEATVHHYKLQEEREAAFHVGTVQVDQHRDSAFWSCSAALGGRLARNNLGVRFGAEGGRCRLDGLYALAGRQHVDNHVTVDHARPRCTSEQLYKGILDGKSRAVFNGRILVRRDAQKTDASQTNKTLLLAEGPEAYSKPQLEIFADDVRCTHGAAEGQLAQEAIFYLKSRGLGEESARTLLTCGFAGEVISRIAVEPIRTHLDRVVRARLAARRSQENAP